MAAQDWTSIAGQIISAGAPILGGILGGPAGGMIGSLIGNLVAGALGVTPTPGAVAASIEANPAAATAKLAPLDAVHGTAMSQLEAELADVADAREQTINLAKEGSTIAWGAPVVSVLVTGGFIGMGVFVLAHGVVDNQVANMMVGTLAAAFSQVLNYWLGSSAGSRAKDVTIGAAVSTAAGKVRK